MTGGSRTLIAAWLLACQPGAEREPARPCPTLPLQQGEVWVGPMVCRDQRFTTSSESRAEDLWLANSRFRIVVRHPPHALSLAGLGGGTLIDAAPWGRADQILEVAPLVGGGWLNADSMQVGDNTISLTGEITPLPDRPALERAGERHTITYRVEPDDPWLYLDGADGIWIHPDANQTLQDGWLWSSRVVLGHDGTIEEDLGGAVRIANASRLLVAEPHEAMANKPGDSQLISGASDGADVRLFRGEELIGHIPVVDNSYEALVPLDIDGVQATRATHAPSKREAPGMNVALPLRGTGVVDLRVGWQSAQPRPIRMRWTATDGRSGEEKLDPMGELLELGSGVYDLELTAGPTVERRTLRMELLPDSEQSLGTTMVGLFDPSPRIYASLAWPGGRSRTTRAPELLRTRDAMLRGMSYIVSVAEDNVSESDIFLSDATWIRGDAGATLRHPDGWSITAWPWNDQPRQAGHGAPPVWTLDPVRSLGLAWGGVGTNRMLYPSLSWFQQIDQPVWAFDPRPTYIDLPSPGQPPFLRWQTWFDWLDDDRFLLPSGPRHWLDVVDTERYGPVDISAAIQRGSYNTGTGAWLDLRVDEAGPGEVIEPEPGTTRPVDRVMRHIRITAHAAQTTVSQVALLTDGGDIIGVWPLEDGTLEVDDHRLVGTWVAALAWSDNTADWAVTAPVWTWPLGTGAPDDTGVDTYPDTHGDTQDSASTSGP